MTRSPPPTASVASNRAVSEEYKPGTYPTIWNLPANSGDARYATTAAGVGQPNVQVKPGSVNSSSPPGTPRA
jgi:hypothetical protein